MIYVSVVPHESVGVVAFSLWAAFELHLRSPSTEIEIVGGSFGLPGNSLGVVDPVPNLTCLMNFL